MAISKGNNDEKILLNIDADASQAENELDSLFKKLEKLKELKINASADDLVKINQEIADIESAINKANKTAIKPIVDTGDIDKLKDKLGDVEMTINPILEDIKIPEGKDISIDVKVDGDEVKKAGNDIDVLQAKLKGLEEVKLSADSSVLDIINSEIEQTKSAIQQLNDTSFKPTFDSSGMSAVESEIDSINDSIDNVNSNKIKPNTDNAELKNTILSINELEDLLQHVRDEQASTNDPLKLKQLAGQAFELKQAIDEAENGFKDTNQTIGILEDKLYAMALAGEQGTAEFGELLAKVAEMKQHVINVDMAVDALSADKFGQFISVGEGMVQAFSGVTASLQLMGVSAESSEAMIAKLVQLQGIAQGLQGINTLRKQWVAMVATMKTTKAGTDAMNALTISTKKASLETQALTTATKAQTVATKITTVASRALGVAMKALGIGLIVSAVALLITHFDTIKKAILNLFPVLGKLGEWFGKIATAVTDFVGVTSDATRALDKLKRANEALYSSLDSQIQILQSMGGKEKEVYEASVKLIRAKRNELLETAKVNKEMTEEQKKELIDLNTQEVVLHNGEKNRLAEQAKDRADKAKDQADKNAQAVADAKKTYDEQLKLLKDYLKQAEEVMFNANHNEREIELKKLQDKYKDQLSSFEKIAKAKIKNAKAEGKNVNDVIRENEAQRNKIVEAGRIEESNINKKYDDKYFDFVKSNSDKFLSDFASQYLDTQAKYSEAMKNATDEQKADLEKRMNNQLIYISKLKQLGIGMAEAEKDLKKAIIDNEVDDEDTFKVQKEKLQAQYDAEKAFAEAQLYDKISQKELENAELERLYIEGQERLKELMKDPNVNANDINILNAELNAKLIAIEENNDAIENANIEHNNNMAKADKAYSKTITKLAKDESKSKIEALGAYGDAIGDVSGILSEHTVAFKALAVSSTLINTYASIAGQLKAFAGVPIPGYAIAQAIATGAVGFAQVAKILSTNVPNESGSSSSSGRASIPTVAPSINTTVLKSAENGNDKVSQKIEQTNQNLENAVFKTYVVQEDLDTQAKKQRFAEQARKIF